MLFYDLNYFKRLRYKCQSIWVIGFHLLEKRIYILNLHYLNEGVLEIMPSHRNRADYSPDWSHLSYAITFISCCIKTTNVSFINWNLYFVTIIFCLVWVVNMRWKSKIISSESLTTNVEAKKINNDFNLYWLHKCSSQVCCHRRISFV